MGCTRFSYPQKAAISSFLEWPKASVVCCSLRRMEYHLPQREEVWHQGPALEGWEWRQQLALILTDPKGTLPTFLIQPLSHLIRFVSEPILGHLWAPSHHFPSQTKLIPGDLSLETKKLNFYGPLFWGRALFRKQHKPGLKNTWPFFLVPVNVC